MAVTASSGRCKVNEGTRRSSSVGCFIGNPDRAYELLGWKHETDLGVGFNKMVDAFKDKLNQQQCVTNRTVERDFHHMAHKGHTKGNDY